MLELIFVIVILGIVSSIGAELIANVYSNYIVQRGAHKSSSKTALAATQIANRLSYAIPNTLIAINPAGNTKESLESLLDPDATILQWIGSDHDSFNAGGWNGFADVNDTTNTTQTTISTPGSNLSLANTIIGNFITGGSLATSAIFFPRTYSTNTIGYGTDPITGLTLITGNSPGIIEVSDLTIDHKTIREHYKIASSAYAIVPYKKDGTTICTVTDFPCDLVLKYNFQPWQGEDYDDASSKVLIRNISAFRFTGSSNTVRFKICQEENIGGDYNITTCKEKAVIR